MPWNDGLTGIALEIARTPASPLRVMAGPGTGKSFAMKRRVARLLEEGADPERILAVTFTRNAAASLVDDLHALGVPGCENIKAATLHSFCFSLLGQQDVFGFLGRVARPVLALSKSGVLQFEGGAMLDDLITMGAFGGSRASTKRIRAFEAAWARLQSEAAGWPVDPLDRQFQAALLDWLRFHHGMLIGELVPEALRFLRNNPNSPTRTGFDHVIVDEYQDLNKAEQDLIDLLAENGTLSIVGDVDQSIYRFRHANPDGITTFNTTHQATHDESLEECRRCPTRVVAIADNLIRTNHPQAQSQRLRPMPGKPDGNICTVQWPTIEAEAEGLRDFIVKLVNEGYAPGEILVMTPHRRLGYAIRDQIAGVGIAVHSFYHEEALENEDAQRAFTILALLANQQDRVALRWWLSDGSPSGRSGAYAKVRDHCVTSGLPPWDVMVSLANGTIRISGVPALVEKFGELQRRLHLINGMTLPQMVDELMPTTTPGCAAIRSAALLALPDCEAIGELFDAIRSSVTQPEIPQHANFVRVMSLQKSKGLTSKVAIVAGCVQGIVPFLDRDATPADQAAILEEQRRLFYVAITRCTEILVLSSASSLNRQLAYKLGAQLRPGGGAMGPTVASQFLAELGPRAPRPITGAAWRTANFGF